MYLRKVKQKKSGRTYLSIVESYRDKETKKPKSRTIQSLGYLDELYKDYPDPIEHFENIVKEMNHKISANDIVQMGLFMDTNEILSLMIFILGTQMIVLLIDQLFHV